jgi:hypothetical protein
MSHALVRSPWSVRLRAALAALALLAPAASAQDLYDTTVLRTINLQFHAANWWTLLQQNYQSQTNILADLTMEGVTYPSVGVRIRGNTSYTALPAGSQKVSLNVDVDFVNTSQTLLGYSSLNLNNSFRDPTFCREVAYNNIVARFLPNARSNHVVVTLNGENWGVYANVQQYNKDLLHNWFEDEDGLRIKCANNPNGPGLRYVGPNPGQYTGYEIKDDGGLADPWGALIAVCNSVTNEPLTSWQNIDTLFAIDPSTWSVVFENLLTDDDSYVNKGADFMTYRDPSDGRMHLHQTDANETWTQISWSPTRNFTATTKPVLSHVLAVPELRQRYMSHYREALEVLDWTTLEAEFTAYRNLIDAAVLADPKRLYSYQHFLDNFTMTVTLPYGGLAGGTIVGIQPFVQQRRTFLVGNAELVAQGPILANVRASDSTPAPGDTVWITAAVSPSVASVAAVELFYKPAPGSYLRTPMLDDGLSGDGPAGDGVYGAVLPVSASGGQRVEYYVGARSANTYGSLSFSPERTEIAPLVIEYSFGQTPMRITEYMYQGFDGEFVEFTNTGTTPIDLSGWSFDDDSAVPGTFSLSGAGVVAPGQSIVVAEATPAGFATTWGLSGVTVLGPNSVSALGRNDQINLFDAGGNLVDRLSYGDESFPGSIRARERSGQVCTNALGSDDAILWVLSSVGDAYGSVASVSGDVGSPGTHGYVSCNWAIGASYCVAGVNVSGTTALISATGSTAVLDEDVTLHVAGANPNVFGVFLFGSTQAQIPFGTGFRCVAGAIQRIYPPVLVGAGGDVAKALDFQAPYGALLLPGSTQNFQFWYRDGASFNFSDGVRVDFH